MGCAESHNMPGVRIAIFTSICPNMKLQYYHVKSLWSEPQSSLTLPWKCYLLPQKHQQQAGTTPHGQEYQRPRSFCTGLVPGSEFASWKGNCKKWQEIKEPKSWPSNTHRYHSPHCNALRQDASVRSHRSCSNDCCLTLAKEIYTMLMTHHDFQKAEQRLQQAFLMKLLTVSYAAALVTSLLNNKGKQNHAPHFYFLYKWHCFQTPWCWHMAVLLDDGFCLAVRDGQ